jgi:hypothetical protein
MTATLPGASRDAVVVGLHAGGVALGRILARLGFRVVGLLEAKEPGRRARCFRTVRQKPADARELVDLARLDTAPIAVFPTSDAALAWLEPLAGDSRFTWFRPPDAVMASWFDKTGYAHLSPEMSALLDPPRTTVLADWRRLTRPEGPWVGKPANGAVAARYGVPKTVLLTSTTGLKNFVEQWRHVERYILLQDWIPGEDTDNAFVGGYADGLSAHVFQVGRKLQQFPRGAGVAVHARLEPLPQLEERTRWLINNIGHRGFFEAEWKWDRNVGRWRFLELNVRPWETLAMSTRAGMDLVVTALTDVGIEVDQPRDRTPPRTPVEWRNDFTLVLEALKRKGPFFRRKTGPVAHAFWSLRDPGPFLEQWLSYVRGSIRRVFGR